MKILGKCWENPWNLGKCWETSMENGGFTMVYSFIMKKSGVNGKTWWENRWVSMDTRGQTCSTPLHNHDISILVHEHCHEKLQLTRAHLPNHISTHLRSGFRIFRCHAVNQETSRNTKTRKHNLQSDILPTYIIGKC